MPGKQKTPPKSGGGVGVGGQIGATYNPCGQERSSLDQVGRLNDLINCYLISAGQWFAYYIPLILLAIILLAIMILAASTFIKE